MKKMYVLAVALMSSAVSMNVFAGADLVAGKALSVTCAACHGADFVKSPLGDTYPTLAGQHRDYIEHALTAYQRGDAANGRSNPIMGAQAKLLSKQDIKNVAAYLSSLPGPLVVSK